MPGRDDDEGFNFDDFEESADAAAPAQEAPEATATAPSDEAIGEVDPDADPDADADPSVSIISFLFVPYKKCFLLSQNK